VAVVAELSGRAAVLHHDHLLGGGHSPWVGVPAFLLGWQLMVAAMMLPSAIPMLAAFRRASARDERPGAARAAFLGAYPLVWTAFGVVAFGGDAIFHRIVEAAPSLAARPWLIEGGVLVLAGLVQFTELKHRCLTQCRTPIGFLAQRYRPGVRGAFAVGRSHGMFCVGCCWALMLVSFAVGLGSLVWMAELTALMVVERAVPGGDRVTAPAGFILVAFGALVLAHPAGLGAVLRMA
jgi:predicted metal-binding membrane protein